MLATATYNGNKTEATTAITAEVKSAKARVRKSAEVFVDGGGSGEYPRVLDRRYRPAMQNAKDNVKAAVGRVTKISSSPSSRLRAITAIAAATSSWAMNFSPSQTLSLSLISHTSYATTGSLENYF